MNKTVDVFKSFFGSEERDIFDKIFIFEEKRKAIRW